MLKQTLILFVLFTATLALAAPPKYKFTSKEGKYSVVFPAEFKSETVKKEYATTIKTTAMLSNQTFLASYTIHEQELGDRKELATVSLESFVDGVSGKITKQSEWKIKKNSGIKATISLSEKDATVEYWVILIGQIQYQVTSVAANSNWDQKAADAFLRSFKVMK